MVHGGHHGQTVVSTRHHFFSFPHLAPHGRGVLLAVMPTFLFLLFSPFLILFLSFSLFCVSLFVSIFFLLFFNEKLQKIMKLKGKKRKRIWIASQEALF